MCGRIGFYSVWAFLALERGWALARGVLMKTILAGDIGECGLGASYLGASYLGAFGFGALS